MYWAAGHARALCARRDAAAAAAAAASSPAPGSPSPPSSPAVLAWAPNPDATLFAAVGRAEIALWNVAPCAVTCRASRAPESLDEQGSFFDAVWAADGASLAAMTTKGFLFIYSVRTPPGSAAFQFNFPAGHHFVACPGQGAGGVPFAKLVFRTVVKMDGGVVTASALPGQLLVSTRNPPALQNLAWLPDSQVSLLSSVLLDDLDMFERPEGDPGEIPVVVKIVHNATFEFCGLMSSNGRLRICRGIAQHLSRRASLPDSGGGGGGGGVGWGSEEHLAPAPQVLRRWACLPFEDPSGATQGGKTSAAVTSVPGCTCVAFNDDFGLVAAGVGSDVHVHRLPLHDDDGDRGGGAESGGETETAADGVAAGGLLRLLFKLSLKNPLAGGSGPSPGSTAAAAWSSDGLALAVGYAHGGFAIWSVYGRLLTTTWPEAEDVPETFRDKYAVSVRSLFWAAADHQLFMLHGPLSEAEDPYVTDQMFALPLAKASVASLNTMENISHSFLELDDRLMLYRGEEYNLTNVHAETHLWSDVQYPTIYITDNWPIKYSSGSETGHYVAVAGYRGVAHYNTISGRWKVFGNQQQERDFVCRGGLLWYKNVLIVACVTVESKQSQIRFYPRERNLDNSQMLCSEQLSAPVACMSMTGTSLLVYTDDNVLCHYVVEVQDQNRISLNVMRRDSLAGVVRCPRAVRAISWFIVNPKGASRSARALERSPRLVLASGSLFMLNPFEVRGSGKTAGRAGSRYDVFPLSDSVEFFWTPGAPLGNMRNSVWACTRGGVKVWANLGLDDDRRGAERPWRTGLADAPHRAIFFPSDCHPLSVLLDKGTLATIGHGLSFRSSPDVASFKVVPKSNLFLQHILRHLLSEGLEAEAVEFARCFQHLPYFDHALEVLLHAVLEDEAESPIGRGEDAVLPRVVRFLRSFPSFLDVIVQCARKSEMSVWDHLFGIVGCPKDLFEECMSSGQLKTAASYLIIIQTSGPVMSKESILLLEKALEVEDFELSNELIRFMRTLGGVALSPSGRVRHPLRSPASPPAE